MLDMEKNTAFTKVIWANDKKYCIISDKEYNGTSFPHFIFVFDSTGKNVCGPVKVKNAITAQSEYCFALGTTIFFLDDSESETRSHSFSITNIVTEDCMDKEERKEIFYVNHSKEKKKLKTFAYSFNVYKGQYGNKAVLAYNNDYADPYKEGFRFRVLDKSGTLSSEDTLNLPYLDRECNIEDLVYDDAEEKIYLLCDYFTFLDKAAENRVFKNSFAAVYDLKTKSLRELSVRVPPFLKAKVQRILKDSSITFAGLRINEENQTAWTASFLSLRKEPFEVIHSASFDLKPSSAEHITRYTKKIEKRFILPVNIIEDKDGSLIAGWTKFFTLTQLAEKNEGDAGTIGAAAFMFGLVGAAIAAAATSGSVVDFGNINRTLWLRYSPQSNTLQEDTISSQLRLKKYYAHSYMALKFHDDAIMMMNKPLDNDCSFIYASPFTGTGDSGVSKLLKFFSDLKTSIIYPGSLYSDSEANYFIAEYDKDCNRYSTNDAERKIYLIRLK